MEVYADRQRKVNNFHELYFLNNNNNNNNNNLFLPTMSSNHTKELENLRKLRATLEAVRESTEKILKDVNTINNVNNPTLLQNSKDFKNALDQV